MLSKLRCRAEGGRIQNGRYFLRAHKAEERLAALWKSGPLPFVKGGCTGSGTAKRFADRPGTALRD
jgi:hypothetical protein